MRDSKNIMVILSSPSGVGKTTLTKKIQQKYQSFKISVSHTTRPPRSNEVDGVDYNFVSVKKFEELIKQNEFYEYAKIFENYSLEISSPGIERPLTRKKDFNTWSNNFVKIKLNEDKDLPRKFRAKLLGFSENKIKIFNNGAPIINDSAITNDPGNAYVKNVEKKLS